MKQCIAYRGIPDVPHAWIRCMRGAERGTHFCRKHGEAVNGAVLGMCVAGLLDGCAKESRSSNKSKSPDAIKTPSSAGVE
jgi:hypothetical protein